MVQGSDIGEMAEQARRRLNGLETPTCTLIYTMAYNIHYDGLGVLGTLNWDLRWIMTRALLRDTRGFSYRSVARSQYTFRLLANACGHQKVFRLRMPYTKHYFGPKAINFGNW